MLQETGVSGHVSDHLDSTRIVEDRVVDYQHIQVYCIPEEDAHVRHRDLDGKAHDVVLRESKDNDGNRKTIESHGFFHSKQEAAEHAAELADEKECVVWDEIIELCPE